MKVKITDVEPTTGAACDVFYMAETPLGALVGCVSVGPRQDAWAVIQHDLDRMYTHRRLIALIGEEQNV